MYKKLQLILMVFCLGIFIFPKQAFDMNMEKMSCCTKTSTKSNCCDKQENQEHKTCDKHDTKKDNSCNKNCSNCKTCTTSIGYTVILNEQKKQIVFNLTKDKKQYSFYQVTPLVIYFNIWQPPKIG